jgi:pyruvate,water dikinase
MSPFATRDIDTEPHPAFPRYSAGNFAEVAPERWSPITWSLIGAAVERGMRTLVSGLWPSARWHTGSRFVFVGYFACRPYHNLSAFAHATRHIPRLDARELTDSYFEGVAPPDPEISVRLGLPVRLAALGRWAAKMQSMPRRIVALDARTYEAEALAREALHAQSALRLGSAVQAASDLLNPVWAMHYETTALSIGVRALQRAVGSRVLPWWSEVEGWIAQPHDLPWGAIHAAVDGALPHAQFMSFPFYEIADAHEPWHAICGATAAAAPVAPAAGDDSANGEDPADVLWRMFPRYKLAGLPNLVALAEDMMRSREATKILAMRTMHLFRELLPHVAHEQGLGDEHWPYLLVDELTGAEPRAQLRDLAAQRRSQCDDAIGEAMPDELTYTTTATPARSHEQARDGTNGRGVSPGIASGRVVTPALEYSERPRILVCPRADADVQHLLGDVDGLVTARGSALSHIAVLVREHGVPAVVGSPRAATLQAGQQITIDGTTGEVNVH